MTQLLPEIWNKIWLFNSHPVADLIRNLLTQVEFDKEHPYNETYYWDPKYLMNVLAGEGHIEICCDYPHHLRHNHRFMRTKSYSAKKFNRELRIPSSHDIDVDNDGMAIYEIMDVDRANAQYYPMFDDRDSESSSSSDSDTPIIAVSRRDPSIRVEVSRL